MPKKSRVGRPKEKPRVPITVRVLKSCERSIKRRIIKGDKNMDTAGKIVEYGISNLDANGLAEVVYKPSVD